MKKILVFAVAVSIIIWIASMFFPEKYENIRDLIIVWTKEQTASILGEPTESPVKQRLDDYSKRLDQYEKWQDESWERRIKYMEDQKVREREWQQKIELNKKDLEKSMDYLRKTQLQRETFLKAKENQGIQKDVFKQLPGSRRIKGLNE